MPLHLTTHLSVCDRRVAHERLHEVISVRWTPLGQLGLLVDAGDLLGQTRLARQADADDVEEQRTIGVAQLEEFGVVVELIVWRTDSEHSDIAPAKCIKECLALLATDHAVHRTFAMRLLVHTLP